MTDLIRWERSASDGYLGYAGTLTDPLFQIWPPDRRDDEWMLQMSTIAGRSGSPVYGSGPDGLKELKGRAEEMLREFAASIGAVFPGPVTAHEERWQALRDFLEAEIAAAEEFRKPYHEMAGLWQKADAAIDAMHGALAHMSELES
jgi:hypothetical protein